MEAKVNRAPNSPLPSSPGLRAPARDAAAAATGSVQLIMKSHDHAPPLPGDPAEVPARSLEQQVLHDEKRPVSNSTFKDADNHHPQRCSLAAGAFAAPEWDLESQPIANDGVGNNLYHYCHKSPLLRALVLGASDGLVSLLYLLTLGWVVKKGVLAMLVSGLVGLVLGVINKATGEFDSVFSKRGIELVTQSSKAALALALASALGFFLGGGVPVLAGAFVVSYEIRMAAVVVVSFVALPALGVARALLGEPICRATITMLVRGCLGMASPYVIVKVVVAVGFPIAAALKS